MKDLKALYILGNIDADLIEEAETYRAARKNTVWIRWAAIAACLCLCIVGAMKFASARKSAEILTAPAAAPKEAESDMMMEESAVCEEAAEDSAAGFSMVAEAPAPEPAEMPEMEAAESFPAENAAAEDDETLRFFAELCRNYLCENEPQDIIDTVTNLDDPMVILLEKLPEEGCYLALAEEAGTGPWAEVTFTTTADGLLGPITYLVNQEGEIIGTYYRE